MSRNEDFEFDSDSFVYAAAYEAHRLELREHETELMPLRPSEPARPSVVPSVLYPALNRLEKSLELAKDLDRDLTSWDDTLFSKGDKIVGLPGKGESYEPCGEYRKYYAAPDDPSFTPFTVKYSCHRMACPKCYQSACRKKARDIERQLRGKKEVMRKMGMEPGKLKHIAISINPELVPLEEFIETQGKPFIKAVQQLMDMYAKNGFYAGIFILHLWRKRHIDGTECCDKNCPHEHHWTYGPHVHFLGYGFLDNSSSFFSETGFTYHRIEEGIDYKTGRRLARNAFETAYYQLSHEAVFYRRRHQKSLNRDHEGWEDLEVVGQAYKWVGLASPHHIASTVVKSEKVEKKTPNGSLIYHYPVDSEGQPAMDLGEPFIILVRTVRYFWRWPERVAPSRLGGEMVFEWNDKGTRKVWKRKGSCPILWETFEHLQTEVDEMDQELVNRL